MPGRLPALRPVPPVFSSDPDRDEPGKAVRWRESLNQPEMASCHGYHKRRPCQGAPCRGGDGKGSTEMNSTGKSLAVGYDEFKKLRKNDGYDADKTGLIRQLPIQKPEVTVFTRPRRFGRSLNMSMPANFFSMDGDKTIFVGLEITKEKDLCEKRRIRADFGDGFAPCPPPRSCAAPDAPRAPAEHFSGGLRRFIPAQLRPRAKKRSVPPLRKRGRHSGCLRGWCGGRTGVPQRRGAGGRPGTAAALKAKQTGPCPAA